MGLSAVIMKIQTGSGYLSALCVSEKPIRCSGSQTLESVAAGLGMWQALSLPL